MRGRELVGLRCVLALRRKSNIYLTLQSTCARPLGADGGTGYIFIRTAAMAMSGIVSAEFTTPWGYNPVMVFAADAQTH